MLHGSNVNPRMWLRKVLVKEMHAASHHQERASLGFIVPVDYLQARVAAVALTVSYNCINGAPTPSRSLCHLMSIIIVYMYKFSGKRISMNYYYNYCRGIRIVGVSHS